LPILSYSLCCAYTIGASILNPLKGEAWPITKICEFLVLALPMRPALPISLGCSAAPILQQQILYSAITVGASSLIVSNLFLNSLPLIWGVLAKNGNIVKTRLRQSKMTKEWPAPWSGAYTHVIRPLLTQLSFRWTLPLKQVLIKFTRWTF
jgi:hypothetical protein